LVLTLFFILHGTKFPKKVPLPLTSFEMHLKAIIFICKMIYSDGINWLIKNIELKNEVNSH